MVRIGTIDKGDMKITLFKKNIFLIKKDVFGKLPRKSPIGSANTQGMEKSPTE